MKIKNRLALNFSLITSAVLAGILLVTWLVLYSFSKNDFYEHLSERAKVAAQLYLEADEISTDSLTHVRENFLEKLPDERIGIYDERNHSFIAHNDRHFSDKLIDYARTNKQVRFDVGKEQGVGIYYKDNQGNFVILVSGIDKYHRDQLYNLARIMLLMFFIINGFIFFIGRWFAERSLAPIDDLITQMQAITVENLKLRVSEGKGKDEISALARNFNRLLTHLQHAFELRQAFIANASHELRTPITSITGEVEVALNKERSGVDYRETLRSVLAEADRLNITINGLMDLAQSDQEFSRAKLSPVSIAELMWELQDYWTKQKGAGKLVVEIEQLPEDEARLAITANRALLTIAFNNIIANGFKFSDDRPVTCYLNATDDIIKLTFTDSGIGIDPAEVDKIFTSFYRGAAGRTYQGTGIGLYITEKVTTLFKGEITVTSEQHNGTSIAITFQTER